MKLTDFLAVYAAGLSTFVFFWNVARASPRIKVEIVHGASGTDSNIEGGVWISIKNVSAHSVHLSNVSLLYPSGAPPKLAARVAYFLRYRRLPHTLGWVHSGLSNYELEDGCPLLLDARKSHQVFVPNKILQQVFSGGPRRELRAVVQDALWQNTYSRPLAI